jgi:hypothetical protein
MDNLGIVVVMELLGMTTTDQRHELIINHSH